MPHPAPTASCTRPLVGLFGGTFDPIHRGHLDTVSEVCRDCALDRVLFIPAASPPHRKQPGTSKQHRLEMLALALADYPKFVLDEREFSRPGPSYTYDTLISLRAEMTDAIFCFILGVDALSGLPNWYRWQQVLAMTHFIVMPRPDWQPPSPRPDWWQRRRIDTPGALQNQTGGQILEVSVMPRAISATAIRALLGRGEDAHTLLPDTVWDYILRHNLYRNGGDCCQHV